MRILLAILSILIGAAPAGAISRYDAWTMSCAEAKSAIRSEGALILRYRSRINPSARLYDRFVNDSRFCNPSEIAELTYIPTADDNSCPVRKCQIRDVDRHDIWRP